MFLKLLYNIRTNNPSGFFNCMKDELEKDLEQENSEESEDFPTDYEAVDEDIAFDDEVGVKDKLKKLRNELKVCQKESMENLTGWQRAQADYANLKRESAEENQKAAMRAKAAFLEEMLPALDSFDMAFSNKEAWEKVDANWRTGVEYIYSQLMSSLESTGVKVIGEAGVPFDPSIHQSVESIPTDDQTKDHTIETVIQKGYKIGNAVVRPARVSLYTYTIQ